MLPFRMSEPEYLEWVWKTRDRQELKVRDMERSHVQNCLNWCISKKSKLGDPAWDGFIDLLGNEAVADPRNAHLVYDKDGHYYRDWIAVFTARLLDPTLP